MEVVQCSECSQSFRDINSFHVHFKILHQSCQKYLCKFKDCNRSYSVYTSFRKHLILAHHVPVFVNDGEVPVAVVPNDYTTQANEFFCVAQVLDSERPAGNSTENNSALLKNLLVKQQDVFVAKLYQNPGLPRNLVGKMITDFSDYLSSPFFEHMQQVITKSLDPNLSVQTREHIDQMFSTLMNPFEHMKSEYARLKYFEKCGTYIPPITYVIDSREERVKTKNGFTLQMKDVLGQFIPLRLVFKKFFELPHVLEDTLAYMDYLKSETDMFSNIMQCEVWKRKVARFDKNDIVIPINLYYDGVEPNSALGPHCEPLGCTYVQVATLPPEWSSRLENIFLALIFDEANRAIYGNKKAFKPLIKELVFLEVEGITVETDKGPQKIYLVVVVVLGDNKALNEICGFVSSFSAHHYCRICTIHKDLARQLFVENRALLRTPENYVQDVRKDDPTSTGIKEECIFSKLPSFQCPTDIAVDQFHDVIEGVAHYTMVPVLKHFHSLINGFITTLNNRLYCLNLGPDGNNRPSLINLDRLTEKGKLKMTGSEMFTFIRVFGVLVCDMVPANDPFYELYLLLNDITSILHAKTLTKDAGIILSHKVKEHHELFVAITKEHLRPKHHFLLHYATLLALLGPFGLLSTIRYEAKHRLITMTANTCMSRVNLPRTVAIKQQLAFCFRCVSNCSIRQDVCFGPDHLIDLKNLETFCSFSLTLPENIFHETNQSVANWVVYKGTKYEPKQIVLYDVDESGLFLFAEIELIIVSKCKPLFILSALETVGYASHVRGYEVRQMTNVVNWFYYEQENLLDPHPLCLFKLPSGESVIVLKYAL